MRIAKPTPAMQTAGTCRRPDLDLQQCQEVGFYVNLMHFQLSYGGLALMEGKLIKK